ncbi:prolipoprotein diacylglyceryl transferase [Zhihengliuella flava]|uniref:Phosphatidylglycerol--prolipoprotein diacylglyceryl transferase n=1 Tax=Zhihengliuella flava TaxID=1285193 RepID=A0A931DE06_9MICC|nr:prolipoprotein diacylglyceryl transferase [Zhihengliuella flava]MBG6085736.1 prolipoprotein diacylglyceryl transferase [Zhihengliuella flava]
MNLASIPSPPAEFSSFSLGPLTIHAYALCILAGIVVAMWLTNRRWRAKGGPEGVVWDICIWAIPFGIIGGRLYHIFSSPDAYFGPGFDGTGDLSLTWQIWRGGLGIWGAVALGLVGAWIACRRYGVKLSAFADAAAPGVLLAQAIGRLGNWFNQELFGGPTTLPWGLEVDATSPNFPAGLPADTLFHPTFLYEMIWNLLGVVVLLALDRRFKFRRGAMMWLYIFVYTLGRVWIEMLRIDDAEMITIFGLTQRLNVWTSVLLLLVAAAAFIVTVITSRGAVEDGVYLPGRRPADEGEEGSADAAESAVTSDDSASTASKGRRSAHAETESAPHDRAKRDGTETGA